MASGFWQSMAMAGQPPTHIGGMSLVVTIAAYESYAQDKGKLLSSMRWRCD